LIFDAEGLAGHDPASGKQLWRQPWQTNQGINVAQPMLLGGDRVFTSSGYLVGGGVFQFTRNADDKWAIERKWKSNRSMQCKFSSPVYYKGFLYGLHDVSLVCLDPETGKQKWRGPEFGYGQIVRREDLLLVLTEDGRVVLAAANPEKYEEVGQFPVFNEKTWNTPALAGNHLYLRNHRQMACFELPVASP
jgi:outer membrane protein assembly factor BamB